MATQYTACPLGPTWPAAHCSPPWHPAASKKWASKKLDVFLDFASQYNHGHMTSGGHRLPKVSLRPLCPTLLPLANSHPYNHLMAVSGLAAHKAGSLWPSSTQLDNPRHTPLNITLPTTPSPWTISVSLKTRHYNTKFVDFGINSNQ
jgi:hypothetical protein